MDAACERTAILLSGAGQGLHIFPHGVGGGLRIGADGNGDLQIDGIGKGIQPIKERVDILFVVVVGHLAEVVDEDVGDVVVAGVETAQEAPQRLKAADRELGRVDHAGLVAQVEAHAPLRLNADHAAHIGLRRALHQLDELLGLALAGTAHD